MVRPSSFVAESASRAQGLEGPALLEIITVLSADSVGQIYTYWVGFGSVRSMSKTERVHPGRLEFSGAVGGPPRLVGFGLALFAVVALALTGVVTVSEPHPFQARDSPYLTGWGWLDGWFQYDSAWYWTIATEGYFYTPGQQSSIAFFPTYPMVVRGVAQLTGGDVQVAGTIVTVVAGAAAAALFALWASARLSPAATRTSVVMLLLYPYAFFLVATMYADALFLLTVIGSFVLLERGHPWLAGIVGALATAGRPVGIAVAVGLVVRLLEIRAEARAAVAAGGREAPEAQPPGRVNVAYPELLAALRRVRLRDAGVLVSVLGFAGWCTYLWLSFGNPLAFVAAESAWGQGSGPHTWFKIAFFGQLIKGDPWLSVTLAVQALFCLAALLLLRRVWRLFGWGYLAFCVVVLAIPLLGTKDFMGTGRYLLAAFPVMAAAGDVLTSSRHRRWLRPLVLSVFAVGLLVGTSLYARGYEVS